MLQIGVYSRNVLCYRNILKLLNTQPSFQPIHKRFWHSHSPSLCREQPWPCSSQISGLSVAIYDRGWLLSLSLLLYLKVFGFSLQNRIFLEIFCEPTIFLIGDDSDCSDNSIRWFHSPARASEQPHNACHFIYLFGNYRLAIDINCYQSLQRKWINSFGVST